MLDQVVMSGAILADPSDEVAHHAQLMITGKIGHALAIGLNILYKVVDYIEQRICLPYITPEVTGGIVTLNLRIHGIHIERQKSGILTVKVCSHEGIVVVYDEMHQCRA